MKKLFLCLFAISVSLTGLIHNGISKPYNFDDISLMVENVSSAPQCKGIAKSTGVRCKLRTKNTNEYCHHHQDQYFKRKPVKPAKSTTSVQCLGTAKSTGNRCKLRTTNSSGYCHHHN